MKAYLFSKNKIRFLILVTIQTMRTAGTVGVAILVNLLIDAVQTAISTDSVEPLIRCVIICGIYAFTLGGIIFLSERVKAASIKHIMSNIRRDIAQGILCKNISEFQNNNSAGYITLLNQHVGAFEENYLKNMFSIYDSFIGMTIGVLLLLWINPIIAVISIIAMAIPSLIPKLFGKKLGILQGQIMQNSVVYNTKIKDIFNGFETIKAFRTEQQMLRLHDDSSDMMENSKMRLANTMALLYALANLSSIAVQFLVMSLAGVFAVKGFVTIGSIVAVTQLTGQVISPAFQLSAKISQFKSVKPICGQIKESMMIKQTNIQASDVLEMEKTLMLEDVSFSYKNTSIGNIPAIEHVSLLFERGKKYAVVGKSGSGKSTLLKLLAGYYDDYSGDIMLDGQRDKHVCATMVHQNLFLFDDTIKNNIAMFEPYSDEAIESACHLAGLDELIAELPDGLETRVEENGSRFSGGEKQRIAVARAILHKNNILLLDEITSSLDTETTKHIEDSILSLENITCVAVTHNLTSSFLAKYDEIIVMDRGKIVEHGSYDKLLAASGQFANLRTIGIQ